MVMIIIHITIISNNMNNHRRTLEATQWIGERFRVWN